MTKQQGPVIMNESPANDEFGLVVRPIGSSGSTTALPNAITEVTGTIDNVDDEVSIALAGATFVYARLVANNATLVVASQYSVDGGSNWISVPMFDVGMPASSARWHQVSITYTADGSTRAVLIGGPFSIGATHIKLKCTNYTSGSVAVSMYVYSGKFNPDYLLSALAGDSTTWFGAALAIAGVNASNPAQMLIPHVTNAGGPSAFANGWIVHIGAVGGSARFPVLPAQLNPSAGTTATATTTSAQIVSGDADRVALYFKNLSTTSNVSLSWSGDAVYGQGVTLGPGEVWEMKIGQRTIASVRAITDTGSAPLAIQEWKQ